MARKHAFLIAIFLGLAAAIGAVAAINTARLGGPQAKAVSAQSQSAQLQRRSRLLNSQAASAPARACEAPAEAPEGPGVQYGAGRPRRHRPRRLRHGCSTSAPPR